MTPRRLREVLADLRTGAPALAASVRVVGPVGPVGDAGEVAEVQVTGVTHDSQRVVAGNVFCAVRGMVRDGHDFAVDAVRRGAAVLLVDHVLALPADLSAVQLVVEDVRASMGPLAGAYWGNPAARLRAVGITGTNGKTSTAHLLDAALREAGERSDVLGTLTQTRTTPEATDLQQRLAEMVSAGTTTLVMEVTSHALALDRVAGMHFAVGVFTNLTQDHLDFHGTMEAYFRAKAKLFEPERADRAVVNLDDPYGRLLSDAAVIPTTGYSLQQAEALTYHAAGSRFTWRGHPVSLRLGGAFSVSNALAAATTASLLGVDERTIASGLGRATVPGRVEPVEAGQPFTVLVDYAHTPDGLDRVLQAARGITASGGRVITVFGCGGDRDRTKRPLMGRIATDRSDLAVLTSDNPRSEDPQAIIDDVLTGVTDRSGLQVDIDRRRAIRAALAAARAGDVVVIAGKGHEQGQTIGTQVLPFDDRVVAMEELAALGHTAAPGGAVAE